jgi:3-oxoacyl-[acyl-carrier protein] reductase
MTSSLDGQVAVVTGGARGIGRAICETLARRGATIISFDLQSSADTVAAIERSGGTGSGFQLDVTDVAEVEAATGRVVAENGRLDILVNNAGMLSPEPRLPFWEIPLADWDLIMRVNVTSVVVVSSAASEPMREARRGRIVNIASNVFTFGMSKSMHYVASKGAVVGITRAMARELGPFGIAVNAVSPGLVATEAMAERVPEEYLQEVIDGQCLHQSLTPRDIADTVAYLAGPEARLVTGQTLLVNGGATMGPS